MMMRLLLILFFVIPSVVFPQRAKFSTTKKRSVKYIDGRKSEFIQWNDEIWKFAESSLHETRSTALLIDIFKKEGFVVQENISGFSTVFIASYGNEGPVIGLFGEYDADEGASNKSVPYKEPLTQDGFGHGGHHNVLGTGSCGAALAIKHLIEKQKLKCSIRYYGTTAEGTIGSKSYLARDGYFNDLDLSLYWHPAPVTRASTSKWDALIESEILITAPRHDILSKELQPTTLDALEELIGALAPLRKQMTSGIRFNYSIKSNLTNNRYNHDTTLLDLRIQCAFQRDAVSLHNTLKSIVENARKNTGVSITLSVTKARHQFLGSISGTTLVHNNISLLGTIAYNSNEVRFVKAMQKSLNVKASGIADQLYPFKDTSDNPELYGYASDIGDASWIAPEIYFTVKTLPVVPMHQWPGTAFSAHSIAHKGMIYAAKLLAMTIIDFVESKEVQREIKTEFEQKTAGYKYTSLVPPLKK